MKRQIAGALIAGAALGVAAPGALGDIDPVRLTVSAPSKGYVSSKVTIKVTVDADKGAFDQASGPIRARVKLAHLCGSTFEGTNGRVALDKPIGFVPSPSNSLLGSATGKPKLNSRTTYKVCAYITDDDRQYASDVDSSIKARKKPSTH